MIATVRRMIRLRKNKPETARRGITPRNAIPAMMMAVDDNAGHDHSGHEQMFRRRFWISLVLSIPVLLTSEMLQGWLGFSLPPFRGDGWVGPVFSTIVFVVGGLPFLQMAWSELRGAQTRHDGADLARDHGCVRFQHGDRVRA